MIGTPKEISDITNEIDCKVFWLDITQTASKEVLKSITEYLKAVISKTAEGVGVGAVKTPTPSIPHKTFFIFCHT